MSDDLDRVSPADLAEAALDAAVPPHRRVAPRRARPRPARAARLPRLVADLDGGRRRLLRLSGSGVHLARQAPADPARAQGRDAGSPADRHVVQAVATGQYG